MSDDPRDIERAKEIKHPLQTAEANAIYVAGLSTPQYFEPTPGKRLYNEAALDEAVLKEIQELTIYANKRMTPIIVKRIKGEY